MDEMICRNIAVYWSPEYDLMLVIEMSSSSWWLKLLKWIGNSLTSCFLNSVRYSRLRYTNFLPVSHVYDLLHLLHIMAYTRLRYSSVNDSLIWKIFFAKVTEGVKPKRHTLHPVLEHLVASKLSAKWIGSLLPASMSFFFISLAYKMLQGFRLRSDWCLEKSKRCCSNDEAASFF